MAEYTTDGLASFTTGYIAQGQGNGFADKLGGSTYVNTILSPDQLVAAYRSSWLCKKIVNIPAEDMFREWRSWLGDKDAIEQIEKTEKRLKVANIFEKAKKRARLMGHAVIFIGTGAKNLEKPLDPEKIGLDGLKYLTLIRSDEITPGQLETNVESPYYDQPAMWRMGSLDIHPSHLIRFFGDEIPDGLYGMAINALGGGESVLQTVYSAAKNVDATMNNVANLVYEANVDTVGVEDLLARMADAKSQKLLLDRFAFANMAKGINRMLILDKDEIFQRQPAQFTGLSDIGRMFVQNAAGAADIPVTRLLGESPSGLNSTGASDVRNYYDRIAKDQTSTVDPATEVFNEVLIRSATGARDESIYYEWRPLWQLDAKEIAETGKVAADTLNIINNMGLYSPENMQQMTTNVMVENGAIPGIDSIIEENPGLPPPPPDPLQLIAAQAQAKAGIVAEDMAPRPLYVSRPLTNVKALAAWATSQGLTLQADPHVTIAYSKASLDWFKAGSSWNETIRVAPGGPRLVEQFGFGTIVLRFESEELRWRHEQIMRAGGSHDFDEYEMHVTIMVDPFKPIDTIEAYQGELIFGPERFEDLK